MSGRIGLHIGLPKTGTTSLQELMFERHPQLRYFGQTNIWTDDDAKTVLRALILGENEYEAKLPAIIEQTRRTSGAIMISDEALTFGAFMLRANNWPIVSDHAAQAARAKRLLGDAEIFIVLRNQADWLVSWHRQGLKTAKYAETDLGRWLDREIGPRRDELFGLLDYEHLVSAYTDAFGADHVHVFLFEDYKADLAGLGVAVAERLGIDAGTARTLLTDDSRNRTEEGFSGLAPSVQRLIRSPLLSGAIQCLPASLRKKLRARLAVRRNFQDPSEGQVSEMRNMFGESNARLLTRLGVDGNRPDYGA